ncbi:MAG: YaaL family protein [Lachnospiraceae bacterium]|nr:YaaL family protein [Lachnospiraceae bacterium]
MKILFHQKSDHVNTDDIVELRKPSIREELIQTRRALEIAYSGFDNVTDPDLIDCYIYEVNSIMKRYKYLLEQAEKNNLLLEEIEGQPTEKSSLI